MEFHFSDQQLKAMPLLAAGKSYAHVAEQVGTSPATICRWLKNPKFKIEVENLQAQRFEAVKFANKKSALSNAEQLQADLQKAAERQKRWSEATQELGLRTARAANEWMQQLQHGLESQDETITSKNKLLAQIIPAYLRASAEMLRAGSDADDKVYCLQEISQRLDDWQEYFEAYQLEKDT